MILYQIITGARTKEPDKFNLSVLFFASLIGHLSLFQLLSILLREYAEFLLEALREILRGIEPHSEDSVRYSNGTIYKGKYSIPFSIFRSAA